MGKQEDLTGHWKAGQLTADKEKDRAGKTNLGTTWGEINDNRSDNQ